MIINERPQHDIQGSNGNFFPPLEWGIAVVCFLIFESEFFSEVTEGVTTAYWLKVALCFLLISWDIWKKPFHLLFVELTIVP